MEEYVFSTPTWYRFYVVIACCQKADNKRITVDQRLKRRLFHKVSKFVNNQGRKSQTSNQRKEVIRGV